MRGSSCWEVQGAGGGARRSKCTTTTTTTVGGTGMPLQDSSGEASAPGVAGADADVDASEDDIGGWGNLFVNLYYALVNLGIMLGSLALLMVAYWLLKWATVRTCSAPPTNTAHIV